MRIRGQWMRWAAAGAAVATVVIGGGSAVTAAAGAPGGLAPAAAHAKASAGSHVKAPDGPYELFITDADFGQMVFSSDQTFQMTFNTSDVVDSGVWVTAGTAIALSVTESSGPDVGCTFSATVAKKSLSSPKKEGNYVCPGGPVTRWYALKQKVV